MRHPALRYGVALIAVVVAIAARYALLPVIGPHPKYLTVWPAVLIVALLAGRNAAIVTGALGGLAAAVLFGSYPVSDTWIEIAFVIATAALAGWTAQKLHMALAAAETRSEDIAHSEVFCRQTLETIPGMVFTARPDGQGDYVSRQWVEYTGVPADDLLGGEGWNNLLHPDDRVPVMEAWRAAVEGRADFDFEARIRRHDGRYEWFKARGRPIRDATGRIVRWFGVAVNVDAFRRANKELWELKNNLESQKHELETIISVVSHDLRAPLLNIRGFSEILKDACDLAREQLAASEVNPPAAGVSLAQILGHDVPEALNFIEAGARAMHNLVESLVQVARAGLVVPKPQSLDMNDLISDIVASIEIKLKHRDAAIEVADLPPCFADRTHIRQVFTNLVDNAIKYLDPDRPGRIRIDGTIDNYHALYIVSDNGIGMEPEVEQRVFEIFFRAGAKAANGEGIGLSVVKRMLEQNGGRIWLMSEKGKGSNFFVILPLPEGFQYPQDPAPGPSLSYNMPEMISAGTERGAFQAQNGAQA